MKLVIFVVMVLMQTQVFASGIAATRVRCQSWGGGYSGTFQCPQNYSGVSRPCWLEAYDLEKKDWIEIEYRVQEGCATGSSENDDAFCVKKCF